MNTPNQNNSLLDTWEAIGKKNQWIKFAHDPRFEKSMLVKCNSLEALQANIGKGNWCLGQGFYYLNLCFINQVDGGDEWLTIKDDYAFESYSFSRIIEAGTFAEHISRMLNASKEACLSLNY